MKKVIHSFKKTISVHLNEREKRLALRALNQFYLKDDECNILSNGEMVAKYPEIEKSNPEFTKSHYRVQRCYNFNVEIEVLEDGNLRLKK